MSPDIQKCCVKAFIATLWYQKQPLRGESAIRKTVHCGRGCGRGLRRYTTVIFWGCHEQKVESFCPLHSAARVVIYTQLLVKSPFGKESSWLWHLNTNWKPDLCIRMASHHMTASVVASTQPQTQVQHYFHHHQHLNHGHPAGMVIQ